MRVRHTEIHAKNMLQSLQIKIVDGRCNRDIKRAKIRIWHGGPQKSARPTLTSQWTQKLAVAPGIKKQFPLLLVKISIDSRLALAPHSKKSSNMRVYRD